MRRNSTGLPSEQIKDLVKKFKAESRAARKSGTELETKEFDGTGEIYRKPRNCWIENGDCTSAIFTMRRLSRDETTGICRFHFWFKAGLDNNKVEFDIDGPLMPDGRVKSVRLICTKINGEFVWSVNLETETRR